MKEMTVNEAAQLLGKTDRTIRNYIKDGRIKARHVENQFGWEYRVYDMGEFSGIESAAAAPKEEKKAEIPVEAPKPAESRSEVALQMVSMENGRLWDEYKSLREANNRLAYDLGVRDQRIKELEKDLERLPKLLMPGEVDKGVVPAVNAAKLPWWKRVFRL